MFRTSIFLGAMCAAGAAQADIDVRFVEGAPKDRFEILNVSTCPTGPMEIVIDLSGSAAGLIFDTTAQGQGVQVFQPFELVAGADHVTALPRVTDGDTQVTLSVIDLPAQASIAFTIDVDDTLASSNNGQIMINGSEISGAEVRMSGAAFSTAARFDETAGATAVANTCLT